MKSQWLMAFSALVLASLTMGCLMEPLTPEEEAALAEMDQVGEMEQGIERSEPEWVELPGQRNERVKTKTHHVGEAWVPDGKPDPIPWLPGTRDNQESDLDVHSSREKPDPIPWIVY